MSKEKTRRRPIIELTQRNITREEYVVCSTPGCRNVVATWATAKNRLTKILCSKCKRNSTL